MLPGIGGCIGGAAPNYLRYDLITILGSLGLTTNLKLCLDAGDANSYTSGQSWLDTSGNGYDFFRGSSSSSQSSDPTFNGSVGAKTASEYWSFDGGDFFTYDTTNETWMQNLHKDNAVFTIVAWVYIANFNSDQPIWSTVRLASNIGSRLYINDTGNQPTWYVSNGTDDVALFSAGTNTFTAGRWNFVGLSLTEATGADGALWNVNGTAATDTSTYTSPSASSAGNTATLGHNSSALFFESGTRLAQIAMWEGTALTAQNLADIFTVTRGRFGV
jgi:hypothetical protein